MLAIAKTRPEPGVETIEVPEESVPAGHVKISLEAASVCGTDLHIWSWDPWSQGRVRPPRIIGHEFCGTVIEVGEGVVDRKVGEFVASESHIVCGHCRQCRAGQAHVCANTKILGVDVDGGFRPRTVLPAANAVPTSRGIPPRIASFQDALGNAVHTAFDGPIEGCRLLVTGLGPIGLMACAVLKAAGAARVYATEVAPYRRAMAESMGVDALLPIEGAGEELRRLEPGGVDGVLEMSGHPSQLALAVEAVRPGGRISCLGVYKEPKQTVDMDAVIFKGLTVQGIVGRRLWETWDQMQRLLEGGLDVAPVVTHELPYTEFAGAMELMAAGKAGKSSSPSTGRRDTGRADQGAPRGGADAVSGGKDLAGARARLEAADRLGPKSRLRHPYGRGHGNHLRWRRERRSRSRCRRTTARRARFTGRRRTSTARAAASKRESHLRSVRGARNWLSPCCSISHRSAGPAGERRRSRSESRS